MSVTAKCLINAKYASNSNTTEYTAGGGIHTIIDKFTAYNSDASARTISIYLVPAGGSAGSDNLLISVQSINAGAWWDSTELKLQVLNPGDFIVIVASVASKVSIRLSGREIT